MNAESYEKVIIEMSGHLVAHCAVCKIVTGPGFYCESHNNCPDAKKIAKHFIKKVGGK